MLNKFKNFWSEERSLTTLLVLLAINMFILGPMIRHGAGIAFVRDIFFSLLLLAGLLTMTRHKMLQVVFVLFVALAILIHWVRFVFNLNILLVWDAGFSLLCVLAFTAVVLGQVGRKGPVTGHRVRGAVAGYLLIGLSCACAYALIAHLIPGSLQMHTGSLQSEQTDFGVFNYFSIVTLTTLGYGDITAVHPVARSVVMAEALVGQLYPAILIARLVTMELETRKKGY